MRACQQLHVDNYEQECSCKPCCVQDAAPQMPTTSVLLYQPKTRFQSQLRMPADHVLKNGKMEEGGIAGKAAA